MHTEVPDNKRKCRTALTGSSCDEPTVNNCVRLGECPSAETTVGVLLEISQTVFPKWEGGRYK